MKMLKSFLMLVLLLAAVPLFAQTVPAPTVDSTLAAAITALVPVAVMLVVWGVRAVFPNIPPILLPILATSLGAALSFVQQLQAVTGGSLVYAAALGALAVVIREVLTTLGVDVSVRKL